MAPKPKGKAKQPEKKVDKKDDKKKEPAPPPSPAPETTQIPDPGPEAQAIPVPPPPNTVHGHTAVGKEGGDDLSELYGQSDQPNGDGGWDGGAGDGWGTTEPSGGNPMGGGWGGGDRWDGGDDNAIDEFEEGDDGNDAWVQRPMSAQDQLSPGQPTTTHIQPSEAPQSAPKTTPQLPSTAQPPLPPHPHDPSAAQQRVAPPPQSQNPPQVYTSASEMAQRNARPPTSHPTHPVHDPQPTAAYRPSQYWAPNQPKQTISTTAALHKPTIPQSLPAWGKPKNVDPWGEPKPQPKPAQAPAPAPVSRQAWQDWGRPTHVPHTPPPRSHSHRPHHRSQRPSSAWVAQYEEDEDEEEEDDYSDESDETYGAPDAWGHPTQTQSHWGQDPRRQHKVTFGTRGADIGMGAGTKPDLSSEERSQILKSLLNGMPQGQAGYQQRGHYEQRAPSSHAQRHAPQHYQQPKQMQQKAHHQPYPHPSQDGKKSKRSQKQKNSGWEDEGRGSGGDGWGHTGGNGGGGGWGATDENGGDGWGATGGNGGRGGWGTTDGNDDGGWGATGDGGDEWESAGGGGGEWGATGGGGDGWGSSGGGDGWNDDGRQKQSKGQKNRGQKDNWEAQDNSWSTNKRSTNEWGTNDGWGASNDGWGASKGGWNDGNNGRGKENDGRGKVDAWGNDGGYGTKDERRGKDTRKAKDDAWGGEDDWADGDGWGAEEEDSWGEEDDDWEEPKHYHASKSNSKDKHVWGGQPDTGHQMSSKTLAHAMKGTNVKVDNSILNKMKEVANIGFLESDNAAFLPVQRAIFGRERKAKDRIHWLFSPNKDTRVAEVIHWIQAMEAQLAAFALYKFLQSRERGALFVNVTFRLKSKPNQPVFDWLIFDQLQSSTDRILQESLLSYDPGMQGIVFIYLPSATGNSVAMWRRKLLVPDNVRQKFQKEVLNATAILRKGDEYVVHVDEWLPSDRNTTTKVTGKQGPTKQGKQAVKQVQTAQKPQPILKRATQQKAYQPPAKAAALSKQGPSLRHHRGQSLPADPQWLGEKKKRKWWQILRFVD